MAESADKNSKTEDPTDKRISETREKGQTAKSIEVNSFVILLTTLLFFTFFGMWMFHRLELVGVEIYSNSAQYELTTDSVIYIFSMAMSQVGLILLPFMMTLALMGVISNYWQNDGWIFSWTPLAPKFNKVSPLSGWKKIIGKEGLMKLMTSLAKISIISFAVYQSLFDEWEKVPFFMELPLEQMLMVLGDEVFWLVVRVLFAILVIAVIDFIYQKHQYKENMKMTKQEVRDERKQQEGDPLIKQRIRQKQFDAFRSRMMSAVPEAEVIITNPTHLSVALRYDRGRDMSPVVVAKGAGHVAMRIREIAKENDITMVEDKPLARTLFKTVDIGGAIPESLYKSVADVLAYVYRLKRKIIQVS